MTIRYFSSYSRITRTELSARTLEQIQREFGARVEPFTLHLPLPELLAGSWMACRESLLVGDARRDLKEVVAATVSMINRCPYCVDAHSIMILASSGKDYAAAISTGRYDTIADTEVRKAAGWASATLSPGSAQLLSPPFSAGEAPEFIGTAVFFHYINRMVSIFLGPSPLPFDKGKLKKAAMRMASWFFGRAIRLSREPCTSLDLLPRAELPEDLGWAKSSPCIAGAYAAFSRAVDSAGQRVLPEKVRESVSRAVGAWDGKDPGPGSAWVGRILGEYSGASKAAGELALLAALAPYRITSAEVSVFSNHCPDDGQLLAVLAWGSFTAAKHIGRWMV